MSANKIQTTESQRAKFKECRAAIEDNVAALNSLFHELGRPYRMWFGMGGLAPLPGDASTRHARRCSVARKNKYAEPPPESECPPRPADNRCQCCEMIDENILCLDHDHITGAFCGWLCNSCNTREGSARSFVAYVRKDPNRARKLADYIDRTRPTDLTTGVGLRRLASTEWAGSRI